MSSISGIQGVLQPNLLAPTASRKSAPTVVPSATRDADGDFDGTKVGQTDGKDFGKGLLVDRRA